MWEALFWNLQKQPLHQTSLWAYLQDSAFCNSLFPHNFPHILGAPTSRVGSSSIVKQWKVDLQLWSKSLPSTNQVQVSVGCSCYFQQRTFDQSLNCQRGRVSIRQSYALYLLAHLLAALLPRKQKDDERSTKYGTQSIARFPGLLKRTRNEFRKSHRTSQVSWYRHEVIRRIIANIQELIWSIQAKKTNYFTDKASIIYFLMGKQEQLFETAFRHITGSCSQELVQIRKGTVFLRKRNFLLRVVKEFNGRCSGVQKSSLSWRWWWAGGLLWGF